MLIKGFDDCFTVLRLCVYNAGDESGPAPSSHAEAVNERCIGIVRRIASEVVVRLQLLALGLDRVKRERRPTIGTDKRHGR